MQKEFLTSWNKANGFKKLDSGASTIPESSQWQIRSHLRNIRFQGCFLEEGKTQNGVAKPPKAGAGALLGGSYATETGFTFHTSSQ
jgi:hypothetical protein